MPVLPLCLVDLLFFTQGFELFKQYRSLPAHVVRVGVDTIDIRRTRHGSEGAIVDHRVRPRITYAYVVDGETFYSSRYFLLEGSSLSDRPEDSEKPGSVSQRMRAAADAQASLRVKVAASDPALAFVDVGWDAALGSVGFWLRAYLVFAAFMIASVSLLTFISGVIDGIKERKDHH